MTDGRIYTAEADYEEALEELARERRWLYMSELAQSHGRVTNLGLWRNTLRRRRERVRELEALVAGMAERLGAA